MATDSASCHVTTMQNTSMSRSRCSSMTSLMLPASERTLRQPNMHSGGACCTSTSRRWRVTESLAVRLCVDGRSQTETETGTAQMPHLPCLQYWSFGAQSAAGLWPAIRPQPGTACTSTAYEIAPCSRVHSNRSVDPPRIFTLPRCCIYGSRKYNPSTTQYLLGSFCDGNEELLPHCIWSLWSSINCLPHIGKWDI